MSCDDDLFGKSFKHFRAPWTFAVCSRPWNAPVGWTGGEPALYRDLDTAACLGLVNGAKVDTGKARWVSSKMLGMLFEHSWVQSIVCRATRTRKQPNILQRQSFLGIRFSLTGSREPPLNCSPWPLGPKSRLCQSRQENNFPFVLFSDRQQNFHRAVFESMGGSGNFDSESLHGSAWLLCHWWDCRCLGKNWELRPPGWNSHNIWCRNLRISDPMWERFSEVSVLNLKWFLWSWTFFRNFRQSSNTTFPVEGYWRAKSCHQVKEGKPNWRGVCPNNLFLQICFLDPVPGHQSLSCGQTNWMVPHDLGWNQKSTRQEEFWFSKNANFELKLDRAKPSPFLIPAHSYPYLSRGGSLSWCTGCCQRKSGQLFCIPTCKWKACCWKTLVWWRHVHSECQTGWGVVLEPSTEWPRDFGPLQQLLMYFVNLHSSCYILTDFLDLYCFNWGIDCAQLIFFYFSSLDCPGQKVPVQVDMKIQLWWSGDPKKISVKKPLLPFHCIFPSPTRKKIQKSHTVQTKPVLFAKKTGSFGHEKPNSKSELFVHSRDGCAFPTRGNVICLEQDVSTKFVTSLNDSFGKRHSDFSFVSPTRCSCWWPEGGLRVVARKRSQNCCINRPDYFLWQKKTGYSFPFGVSLFESKIPTTAQGESGFCETFVFKLSQTPAELSRLKLWCSVKSAEKCVKKLTNLLLVKEEIFLRVRYAPPPRHEGSWQWHCKMSGVNFADAAQRSWELGSASLFFIVCIWRKIATFSGTFHHRKGKIRSAPKDSDLVVSCWKRPQQICNAPGILRNTTDFSRAQHLLLAALFRTLGLNANEDIETIWQASPIFCHKTPTSKHSSRRSNKKQTVTRGLADKQHHVVTERIDHWTVAASLLKWQK